MSRLSLLAVIVLLTLGLAGCSGSKKAATAAAPAALPYTSAGHCPLSERSKTLLYLGGGRNAKDGVCFALAGSTGSEGAIGLVVTFSPSSPIYKQATGQGDNIVCQPARGHAFHLGYVWSAGDQQAFMPATSAAFSHLRYCEFIGQDGSFIGKTAIH